MSEASAWSEGFRAGREADHNPMWWPPNPYRKPLPPVPLPITKTEASHQRCATCDGGGCPDCTDPT